MTAQVRSEAPPQMKISWPVIAPASPEIKNQSAPRESS
jgi:hypothetical protein